MENFEVKLLDFGLAESVDENGYCSNSTSGTPFYISPEQLRGSFQSLKSDIWSLGCIYFYLLNNKSPFQSSDDEILNTIDREYLFAGRNITRGCLELISACLTYHSILRPDWVQMMSSHYFALGTLY